MTAKASIDIYIYIYTSRQSVVKQGFQKTHFPIILKPETFFTIGLVNIYLPCKISDLQLNFNMVFKAPEYGDFGFFT